MRYNINLLEKKSQSGFEKLTYFFSNYLRYILVITQLIVIAVLFYRFRVDQSIIELEDAIGQKKAIIKETSNLIAEARAIETKTTEIQNIITEQAKLEEIVNYLFNAFPRDVSLTKIELIENSVRLTGDTPNPRLLQVYYGQLRNEKRFEKIDLADVHKNEGGFTFTLTLDKFISAKK